MKSGADIAREMATAEQESGFVDEFYRKEPLSVAEIKQGEADFLEEFFEDFLNYASINELSTLGFNIQCELRARDKLNGVKK